MNNFGFDLLPNVITNLTSKLTVLYICQSGTSGYANAAKGYIYDLIQQDISVTVRTFSTDNTDIVETSSFDSLINSKKKSNSYFNSVVIHSTPDMWGHLANIAGINGKNVIGRTVWEFDKLIPQWVDAINNSIVNTVSVPTNWNKTVFEQSGVKKPIIVEPHIYVKFPYVKTDLENLISQKGMVIYKGDFSKIDVKSAYKLYTIGQFIHRKGIAETIESYCKSFHIKDNVILFVKTFGNDYSTEEQYKCLEKIKNIIGELNVPPIVFLNQMFTYDEIQSLHEQCDCYVQLTRSEGFGLGIFEAFNRGKNLIVTNYGGHTEYLPKSYEGLVQYEKVPVTDPIYSNFELDTTYEWAKPNLEHAKKIIKSHLGLIDKEIPSNQTVNVALLEPEIENIKKSGNMDMNQKSISISFPVKLNYGWHDLESYQHGFMRWASMKSVMEVDAHHEYSSVDIIFGNYFSKKKVKFFVKERNGDILREEHNKIYEMGEQGIVSINIENAEKIILESDCFCPKEIGHNDDRRKLSIMMFAFHYKNKNGEIDICSIENVKHKNDESYDQIFKKDDIIIEYDRYFSQKKCTKDVNVLNEITVLITCHGNRVKTGQRAYQSVIETGIKNVSIVLSGSNKEYLEWANNIKNLHSIIVIDGDKNNNDCWIEGLKSIRTKWTILLHDDDILTVDLLEELTYLNDDCKFGMWNGSVENLDTNFTELENTIDINVNRGVYNVKMVRDLIEKYPLTISPIHGVFPTKQLIDCFEEWGNGLGKENKFHKSPTFVVGNDIFLWLYFTKNDDDLCFVTNTRGSKCISHAESATVVDINTGNTFKNIYSDVKDVYIGKRTNHGIILYLPNFSQKHINCLDNLYEYRHSKYDIPVVVYTDSDMTFPTRYNYEFIRTPKIPLMENAKWSACDKYASWAFIDAIRIANEKGWDYFLGYEWDCKVGSDDWYDILWQQHLSWQTKPILTGTPVFKCPPMASGNILHGSTEYRNDYAKQCKLNMLVENVYPFSLYTNGALTFNDTQKVSQYYNFEINNKIQDKSSHMDELGPFDMFLGTRIFEEFKEKSFEKVGWLPSSYSGCGDFFYNQTQRNSMLQSKFKVAIHQHKYI